MLRFGVPGVDFTSARFADELETDAWAVNAKILLLAGYVL